MRIEQKLIFPLLLIAFGNLITGIIKNENLTYYVLYVGIFLGGIPILYFLRIKINERVLSYVFLVFSLVSILINDASVLNDVFFLTFSLVLFQNKKWIYGLYSTAYIGILISRYSFGGYSASEMSVHLAGYLFIFFIFQDIILPKVQKCTKTDITLESYYSREIKDDIVDIVNLRCQGFDWPEINDKLELNITDDRVRRKVTEERNRLGFKTQDSFVLWLTNSGIIQPVSVNCENEA